MSQLTELRYAMSLRLLVQSVMLFLVVNCSLDSRACLGQLPPLRELITEVSEAHARYAAETDNQSVSCLMDIAEAQMLVGESTAALQTARLLDGFWRMAALSSCAEIQLERTGKLLELPQSFFSNDAADETERLLTAEMEYRLFRLETAKLLIRSGYQDRAKEYLPDDDGEFLTTSELFDFNVETALHLLEAGRAEAARSHLQKITSLTQRYKTVRWGGSKDSFLRLAESCVAAGADESAITCHDTLGSLMAGLSLTF
ncbi:MAG: hypothetical protein ACI8P0_005794 [Planctomycetaceae bacterium]|jgi:hypothetical protein